MVWSAYPSSSGSHGIAGRGRKNSWISFGSLLEIGSKREAATDRILSSKIVELKTIESAP